MANILDFLWKNVDSSSAGNASARARNRGAQAATHAEVHFDPKLVARLISDHQMLLGIFGEIGDASKQKNSTLLRDRLSEFGNALRGHLLTENIKFYLYLQHSLAGDAESAAVMQEFRRDMQHIGKAVGDFLNKYENLTDWNNAAWEQFGNEVMQIGKVLIKRIQTEENVLYPLYLPAGGYK